MTRIAVSRISSNDISRLWQRLADLSTHTDWMKDAKSIEFVGDQRRGVGTKMLVQTVVGPLRTLDEMEVVGWEEGRYIDVKHTGLVTGTGRLEVEARDDSSSLISWDEELTFPWWLGGPITGFFAKPVLGRIWAKNLEQLDSLASGP